MSAKFQLRLLGANVFQFDEERLTGTGIAIMLQIWNVGEKSAAVDWALKIEHCGDIVMASHIAIPQELRLSGAPAVTLYAKDDLSAALGNIARAPLRGHILFKTSMARTDVIRDETKLMLSVQDIWGNTFAASKAVGEWRK